ncbi:MAG TPA: hypothetical protein EYQ74_14615 [Planctomycetes bacterium]|nr:hypothetical protein [Planctomycetota bacterium]HIK61072.1 hypothetical protein [Planctomycetota bacterium]
MRCSANRLRSLGSHRRWALALVVLALVSACTGPAEPSPSRPNVLLICMDTVRADHVGFYGYETRATTPALDELAATSTVFMDTSATAGWTKPSVPSYLTSTYPLQHGTYLGDSKGRLSTETDALSEKATTVAEIFSDAGYQTAAFVKNAQLRKGLGFEQGFDSYDDQPGDAREIRWRAQDWLTGRDEEQPFFLYLHFLDAHWPYPVPPEYAFKFVANDKAERFRRSDWRDLRKAVNRGDVTLLDEEVGALVALYDGAIRYIDDQLQQLLASLEHEGLAEDTIVCVIADHGEEFMEHGKIGHGHGLYENLLQVPWILHVPGRPGQVVEAPCSLVDLMPTLVGAAGLSAGDAAVGLDLLREAPAERLIFAEHLNESYYQQTFRRRDQKHLVEFRPGTGLKASVQDGGLDTSVRWKVELTIGAADRVATKVEPELTDDLMEATEIKAPIENLKGEQFDLCGVPVVIERSTTFYGDGMVAGLTSDLREGQLVKAKGSMSDAGIFVPEKLKVYATDAVPEAEVRGRILAFEPGGRLNLGGIWISVDGQTDVRSDEGEGKPRLSRELLVDLFLDSDDLGSDDRVTLTAELLNLGLDPGELTGRLLADGWETFSIERSFVRTLSTTRFWGSGDRVEVTPEQLEALRAIGYAE